MTSAPKVPAALLLARLVGLGVVTAAILSGRDLLAWLSVPVLVWSLLVVWGRRVVFLENLRALPRLRPLAEAPQDVAASSKVTVISPARNEEAGIEQAVRSLAVQSYPRLDVLVVDDHSTDSTPVILDRLAGEFSRIRILRPPPLPEGWAGKPYASWFAFLEADPEAEWLLFTDARVVFHPDAVRAAILYAERQRLDFLSCIFRFDAATVGEGLIAAAQARFAVAIARDFVRGVPEEPVGFGAFTLIRRRLYSAIDGHAAFRSHPMEDFMLARLARHHGAKMAVAAAPDLLSLRRYRGLPDARRRILRSMRIATNDRLANLLDRACLECILYVMPCAATIAGLAWMSMWMSMRRTLDVPFLSLSILGLLTYLAGVVSVRSFAELCRFRSVVAWLHPFGGLFFTGWSIQAIFDRVRGRPVVWKERAVRIPI